jgi:alkylation response protein AidB-like acyl-CoA dehydrogenase
MSLPDRNNPYRFDTFQQWRNGVDYYRDDPFFQEVVNHFTAEHWPQIDRAAKKVSWKASFRWRDMAERIARPEERPYILHYDGMQHRIDRLVRPRDIEIMEQEVLAEALFSVQTPPWEKLVKMYLIYQNGEACIACPLTCTEGLVELLRRFADTPELKKILKHCAEGLDGHFAIGAQYLTEIQGGSDVPANVLEAVQEEDRWRLYGTKFFCSATHADYAVVTAKPPGSEQVGIFIVPSWLPGAKEKEIRNGYTIDRLKWKLGTTELTTAEIAFNGALAYPVGPLERGLANVVGIVLTYSRLTVGLSAAAFMTRAVREAKQYAKFREAFGMPIGNFPLLAGQLAAMEHAAQRTTAGAFKVYQDFLQLEGAAGGRFDEKDPEALRRRRLRVRELVMLQKITASWDAVDVIRSAMSVFGGHGVIEDFSCLPRLYRDAAVNELWEGPRNVLLTQIHRDLQQALAWYPAAQFVADILQGQDAEVVQALGDELQDLLAHPDLHTMDEATLAVARRWDAFCHRFFHAHQDLALREVRVGVPTAAGE